MLDYREIEAALGAIVFGPNTDTLEGIQWTAGKLRQAATLLEYRYAIERRTDQSTREQVAIAEADDTAQLGQQLAPAKRKRRHRATSRTATNGNGAATPGQATHEPPPPDSPLFPPAGVE